MTRTTSPRTASRPHFCERLVGSLGVAEIDRPGEELLGAVDPAGGEELLRADHAEEIALFVADEVLPAVASGEREITGAHQLLVLEPCEHGRVLVVGMRRHEEHRAHDGELLQGQMKFGGVEGGGGTVGGDRPRDERRKEHLKDGQAVRDAHGSSSRSSEVPGPVTERHGDGPSDEPRRLTGSAGGAQPSTRRWRRGPGRMSRATSLVLGASPSGGSIDGSGDQPYTMDALPDDVATPPREGLARGSPRAVSLGGWLPPPDPATAISPARSPCGEECRHCLRSSFPPVALRFFRNS